MARMASRPNTITVFFRGIPYTLDLVACRAALVDCQVKGELDSMESLANAVEVSRSTTSRFFSGRATSLAVTLKILNALHLTFDAVAHRTHEPGSGGDSDAAGPTAAPPVPMPNNGRGGATRRRGESEQ